MSGDSIIIALQSFYNTNADTVKNSSFSDVLNSLSNGLVTATGGAHGKVSDLTAPNSTVYTGLTSLFVPAVSSPLGFYALVGLRSKMYHSYRNPDQQA